MNFKILKAVKNSIENTIYAFFDASELTPKITPSILDTDSNNFQTLWWSEPECYGVPYPEIVEELGNRMVTELSEQLKSRGIIASIEYQMVQQFQWNEKQIDLSRHNVNFAFILKGKIIECVGTIYRNEEDLQNLELEHLKNDLISSARSLIEQGSLS